MWAGGNVPGGPASTGRGGELGEKLVVQLGIGQDHDVVTGSQLGVVSDGDQLGVADHDADPHVPDPIWPGP